ncbi:MAG: glycosyltransferase [Verrucomicrobia bacterium]|nr:glycosyltransferase [Verrucomicrobiota bacterium]
MRLVIVHYHLRPGGIRRVIELAAPHLVKHASPPITHVTLAVGEALDQPWNDAFRRSLPNITVEFAIHPTLGYAAERRTSSPHTRQRLRAFLDRLFAQSPDLAVWAHNLGIARNLILADELSRACARHRAPLIAHHHDWWFDNRWQRWPEIQRSGARTLAQVAPLTIVAGPNIHHATINRADAAQLRPHLGKAVTWLPNLAGPLRAPRRAALARTRAWLKDKLQADDPPVWIFPCRLLRRKNIAEALLLTRWLRPGAWLITTGGASSADEQAYAQTLERTARSQGWPLRLGILAHRDPNAPGVPELMGASETVLLTSIQEGFGLPYLEAAAAGRPLVARILPNIAPDLRQFGFRFPQSYSQILIHPDLFDWNVERLRQDRLFREWRGTLPRPCRALVGLPALLAADGPRPVPFSRLTLPAQLEVLRHDPELSWNACHPINPFLKTWRLQARHRRLQLTPWPDSASRWLGGQAYAARFLPLLRPQASTPVSPAAARAAQADFIKAKLAPDQLYPLLWTQTKHAACRRTRIRAIDVKN